MIKVVNDQQVEVTDVGPQTKGDSKNSPSKDFFLSAKNFFLTYSNYNLEFSEILKELKM